MVGVAQELAELKTAYSNDRAKDKEYRDKHYDSYDSQFKQLTSDVNAIKIDIAYLKGKMGK